MESIVAVAGHESTAVKRKMSDIHEEQSQNTDGETVETSSTEPDKTLVNSVITKNVPSAVCRSIIFAFIVHTIWSLNFIFCEVKELCVHFVAYFQFSYWISNEVRQRTSLWLVPPPPIYRNLIGPRWMNKHPWSTKTGPQHPGYAGLKPKHT